MCVFANRCFVVCNLHFKRHLHTYVYTYAHTLTYSLTLPTQVKSVTDVVVVVGAVLKETRFKL